MNIKTIIAGSRTCTNMDILLSAIDKAPFKVTEVVCGKALGADTLGELYGHINHLKLYYYKPNWEKYGKRAGMIRNEEMAMNAEALIALWDGQSNGTKNMIQLAKEYNLKTYIYEYNNIFDIPIYKFLIDNV